MQASYRAPDRFGHAPPLPRPRDELAVPDLRDIAGMGRFDVFLAYNTEDVDDVVAICEALRGTGIRPWIDVEQVRPGTWAQDAIQIAMRLVRTAALFLGPCGVGRWQQLEIRAFVERCVSEQLPVIPVLLPGVSDVPSELVLLRQLNHVRFVRSVHEEEPLWRLHWGITGRPTRRPPGSR